MAPLSQVSRTAGMLEMSSWPAGSIEMRVLRPSVGPARRLMRPSRSRAAVISAIGWGRTCSAVASALAVVGPSRAMRPSTETCDYVQRILLGSDSARSRTIAYASWPAMSWVSGSVMNGECIKPVWRSLSALLLNKHRRPVQIFRLMWMNRSPQRSRRVCKTNQIFCTELAGHTPSSHRRFADYDRLPEASKEDYLCKRPTLIARHFAITGKW